MIASTSYANRLFPVSCPRCNASRINSHSPTGIAEGHGVFDIALSAIGAEHCPNGEWSATIHSLGRASVAQCSALLLKPLVNWKYALATLERVRRYARELGYAIPAKEEAEVWCLGVSHVTYAGPCAM